MTIPVPDWLRKLEQTNANTVETRLLRNRYFIRTIAFAYSSDGSLNTLAQGVGASQSFLCNMYAPLYGLITPQNAEMFERVLGRHIITKELLRPDYFTAEATSSE